MNNLYEKVDTLSRTIIQPEEPSLTLQETKIASSHLVKPLWKAVTRVKRDAGIAGQEFGLFSFTPSHGAQPNKFGVYGTAKLRGNYPSEESAADGAEHIIRNYDSCNEIYTIKVGQEFPLTKDPKFSEDFSSIDLSKTVSSAEKARQKEDREKSKVEKKTMVDREQKLLNEHKQILDGSYKEDPVDVYIRSQVKRSQLKWTLENTRKRIAEEIIPALNVAEKEVKDIEKANPHVKSEYIERYMNARKESGLTTEFTEETGTQLDFMKYLLEDCKEE